MIEEKDRGEDRGLSPVAPGEECGKRRNQPKRQRSGAGEEGPAAGEPWGPGRKGRRKGEGSGAVMLKVQ